MNVVQEHLVELGLAVICTRGRTTPPGACMSTTSHDMPIDAWVRGVARARHSPSRRTGRRRPTPSRRPRVPSTRSARVASEARSLPASGSEKSGTTVCPPPGSAAATAAARRRCRGRTGWERPGPCRSGRPARGPGPGPVPRSTAKCSSDPGPRPRSSTGQVTPTSGRRPGATPTATELHLRRRDGGPGREPDPVLPGRWSSQPSVRLRAQLLLSQGHPQVHAGQLGTTARPAIEASSGHQDRDS